MNPSTLIIYMLCIIQHFVCLFLFSSYLCSCICQIIFTNSRGGESESAFTQLLHLSTCALLRHYHFTVLYLHCLSGGNFVFNLNDCNSSSLLCRQSFNIYMINSGYFTIFHIIKSFHLFILHFYPSVYEGHRDQINLYSCSIQFPAKF